jgi:hypothetical protein
MESNKGYAELRRVERAARRGEAARRELEAAMRAARDAGVTLRPIAQTAGLSVEWTRRLIAQETQREAPGKRRLAVRVLARLDQRKGRTP